jgi:hypothetical protein
LLFYTPNIRAIVIRCFSVRQRITHTRQRKTPDPFLDRGKTKIQKTTQNASGSE